MLPIVVIERYRYESYILLRQMDARIKQKQTEIIIKNEIIVDKKDNTKIQIDLAYFLESTYTVF